MKKKSKLKPNPKWVNAPYEISYWFYYKPVNLNQIKKMFHVKPVNPDSVTIQF